MAMPLRQTVRIGTYLLGQKLRRREKFPLIVELEPLFACNLACEGCGKIQHPAGVLKQRMPVAQAVGAVLESGAPMVSIAGGEPLMHPHIDEIVRQLVARRKYVFLCTNAMLLRPPGVLEPRLGPDSYARHTGQARRRGVVSARLALPRIALDIDTPADLTTLVAGGGVGETLAVCARLRIVERLETGSVL